MARVCKKCGERLFPTDTFCGFCGEPVEDANLNLGALGGGPRPLVGDNALTSEERTQLDNLKAKYAYETRLKAEESRRAVKTQRSAEARKMTASEMNEKRAKILAAKRQEEKRLEAERRAAEEAARQEEAKRLEAERLEAERLEAERLEAERLEAERLEAERLEAERLEAERLEAERLEAERLEAERLEAERLEAERLEAERLEAERLEAERLEAERLEEERLEAERLEAERLEEERLEAERLEAERLEAKRLEEENLRRLAAERKAAEEEAARLAEEAERLEAERLEAERLEAERLEEERLEAKRLEEEHLRRLAEERKAAEEEAARLEKEAAKLEEEAGLYTAENAEMDYEEQQPDDYSEALEEQHTDREDEAENLADILLQDETEDDKYGEISWEEADRRAREEQINENRVIRRKRINEGSRHLNRDIAILTIGIIILIILLALLLRDEIQGLKGNDSERVATPGIATDMSAEEITTTPTDSLEEEYTLSDAGTSWDGSIAEKFLQGTGEENSPYLLTTGSELAFLASEVNRGVNFKDSYFELANDIDLSGMEWTPIGYYSEGEDGSDLVYSFNGNFDGKGYKISNFTISTLENARLLSAYSDNNVCGLFGTTYGAVISNLTIENTDVNITKDDNGEIMAGVLLGCAYSTTVKNCQIAGTVTIVSNNRICAGTVAGAAYDTDISDIDVTGVIDTNSQADVNDSAILCGFAQNSSASDITLSGGVKARGIGNAYCGGAFGYGTEMSASNISGDISVTALTESETAYVMAGGAYGYYVTGIDSDINIKVVLEADAVDTLYAGGIYGYADSVEASGLIVSANVTAEATGNSATVNAGGIAGGINSGNISGTSAEGSISSTAPGTNYTGGIAGNSTSTAISSIDANVNLYATASESDSAIVMCGGVCGSDNNGTIKSISTSGTVTVNSSFDGYSGGAFGYIKGGAYESVKASGDITNTSTDGVSSGGIVGYQSGKVTMTDCSGSKNRTNDGKNVYDSDTVAITK